MIAIARQGGRMGCTYQDTAAEFSDPAHLAHAVSVGVKTRARAKGISHPRATAEAVFMFLKSIWVAVRMFGPNAPLARAETAVRRLFVLRVSPVFDEDRPSTNFRRKFTTI